MILPGILEQRSQQVNLVNDYSLRYQGDPDYVKVGNSSIHTTQDMTLEVWIKINTLGELNGGIGRGTFSSETFGFGFYGNTNQTNYYLLVSDKNGDKRIRSRITDGTDDVVLESFNTIPIGSWFHAACSTGPSGSFLYVNGDQVDSSATRVDLGTRDGVLGFGSNEGDRGLDGWMDEIRLWSIQRSQSEINDNQSTIYNSNSPPTGLIGYWRSEEGSGSVLKDLINGEDGTITNATYSTDVPFSA